MTKEKQSGGFGAILFGIAAALAALVLLLGCYTVAVSSTASTGAALRLRLSQAALEEYDQRGGVSGGGEKYWRYWNKGKEDWCVDFVYYCADRIGCVGDGAAFGTYTAGCVTAWNQLCEQGAQVFSIYDEDPAPGDVVFWYTTTGGAARQLTDADKLCHIGIVVDYESGILTTVEGNCGGSAGDSYVAKNTYTGSTLYGQAWSGAALFGFARVQFGDLEDLKDMVKAFEGFSKYPVWDYAQYSVGYGTACPDDKLELYRRQGIPQEEADALLEQYLAGAVQSVEEFALQQGLALSKPQEDALVSLTYNIGAGWMTDSSYAGFRSAITQRSTGVELVQAFANICHAGDEILPSLVERRICEASLYLTGAYTADYTKTRYDYTIEGGSVVIFER